MKKSRQLLRKGGALVVRNSERVQGPLRPRNISQARPVGTFSPGGLRLEFLRRAQRDLDLDPEQRERIDKLLKVGVSRITPGHGFANGQGMLEA